MIFPDMVKDEKEQYDNKHGDEGHKGSDDAVADSLKHDRPLFLEPVTDAGEGLYHVLVRSQLFPEVHYVYVDSPVDDVHILSLDAVDDIIAREYLAGVRQEEAEDFKFGLGQINAAPVHGQAIMVRVQFYPLMCKDTGYFIPGVGTRHPAEHCLDPRL